MKEYQRSNNLGSILMTAMFRNLGMYVGCSFPFVMPRPIFHTFVLIALLSILQMLTYLFSRQYFLTTTSMLTSSCPESCPWFVSLTTTIELRKSTASCGSRRWY